MSYWLYQRVFGHCELVSYWLYQWVRGHGTVYYISFTINLFLCSEKNNTWVPWRMRGGEWRRDIYYPLAAGHWRVLSTWTSVPWVVHQINGWKHAHTDSCCCVTWDLFCPLAGITINIHVEIHLVNENYLTLFLIGWQAAMLPANH